MDLFAVFREAGEKTDQDVVNCYGEPARSLYTSKKILSVFKHIDIVDDNEKVCYQADTQLISFTDKTRIKDESGSVFAVIDKQIISFNHRYHIKMTDGKSFVLSNELFHITQHVSNIKELGWKLKGNIFELDFALYDSEENVIAVIGQKLISMHNKYCIDIYRPEEEKTVIAILIALQHMMVEKKKKRR